MTQTYKIIRHYQRDDNRARNSLIKSGLTLAEAQEHCKDPETSSQTATGAAARRLTAERGPWFDGYTEE